MKTLSDLHAHIRSYLGNDTAQKKAAAVARAAASALRKLPTVADWEYYRGTSALTTDQEYLTGTIEYDHTGGSSERLLTLTGGTFPTWAGSGVVEIEGTPYDVQERLTATTLTLKSTSNPGADLASGTAYRLYRLAYALPSGLTSIDRMYVATDGNQRVVEARHPRQILADRAPAATSGVPYYFGFESDGADAVRVVLWPPSDRSYRLDFCCARRPTVGRFPQTAAGKVSVAASSVTAAGSNTLFLSGHAGCVLRVSADNTPPTGEDGLNPAVYEGLIDEVASATSLTVTTAPTDTLAGAVYEISSRIDVEDGPMWDLLLRLADESARLELRMDPTDEEASALRRAVSAAREVDNRRYSAPSRASGPPLHWGRLARPSGEDMT